MTRVDDYFENEFRAKIKTLTPDAAVAGLLLAAYDDDHRRIEREEGSLRTNYEGMAERLVKIAELAHMTPANFLGAARQVAMLHDLPLGHVITLVHRFFVLKQEREQPPAEKRPGVILHLSHGRTNPSENMEDWGADGPRIPCVCFGFTYDTLWIILPDEQRIELHRVLDCIEWEGVYYGDFEVIPAEYADRPGSVVQQHPA